ncbi:MAG: hypothetical protein HYV26_12160, partial [Candidatus Hydrogenedentes bacterium]|nr:hypothetical protein [Candidatus Hydrogenedentota bacterium]
MADEQKKPGEGDDLFGESGLGNLPPLSDFDSQAGFTSDHESLPPLSGFDAAGDSGGLPPLSDIESETPLPRQPDRGKPMTFDSGPTAIDTPAPSRLRTPGTGFQDIAADSDFSPETPEIGPGPDSNVDTPMFDSAFGGGDQDFDVSVKTPAPTQAMETPMFGEQGGFGGGFGGGGGAAGGGFGFDEGAFGAGTPAPDFSPDTEMRRPGGAGPGAFPEPPAAPAPKKRGGSVGVLVGVLIALIIGLVAAPYLSPYIPFLPNPLAEEVRAKDQTIAQQKKQIDEFKTITDQGVGKVSQEELSRLTTEIATATETLGQKNADLEKAATDLTARREELDLVERDLAAKSEEFALAQAAYEDLLNATAITQARQKGLASEVERLTNLVGELDAANARRAATKESLEHNIDRLLIQVKESLPLTP